MAKKIMMMVLALCIVIASACAEEALLDRVKRIAEDGEDLIEMDEDDLYDIIGIEPDEYTDFAYLTDHDALSGREVIVLLASDEEAAQSVAEKLENYREQRMRVTRNYLPEAYRVLSEAEVLQEDLLVVLTIAPPDPQEAGLLLQEE